MGRGDTSSGFLDTPSVRLQVRSSLKEIHEVRHENEWPIARTEYTRLYLTEQQSLSLERPQVQAELGYPAKKGKVEVRPENAGQETPDDMALFVAVNKLDRDGNPVYFYGPVGSAKDMVTRGYCRVSRRELDPSSRRSGVRCKRGPGSRS